MKKLLSGLLTLVVLIGAGSALAGGPGGPGGPGPGGPGGPGSPEGVLSMVLPLGLTDAQKHDVAVILKKSLDKFDADRAAMHESMKGLGDVMRSDPGNEQLVRQACRKIAAAAEERAVASGKLLAEVKAVLTPEQIKKLEEMAPPPPPRPGKDRPLPPLRSLVDEWIVAHAGQGK